MVVGFVIDLKFDYVGEKRLMRISRQSLGSLVDQIITSTFLGCYSCDFIKIIEKSRKIDDFFNF